MQSEVHYQEAIEEYFKTLVANLNSINEWEDAIEFTKKSSEEEYSSRSIHG